MEGWFEKKRRREEMMGWMDGMKQKRKRRKEMMDEWMEEKKRGDGWIDGGEEERR